MPGDTAAIGAEGIKTAVAADGFVRPIRTHRDQILLVRPDRYVAGAFDPAQEFAFAESFRQILHSQARQRLSA